MRKTTRRILLILVLLQSSILMADIQVPDFFSDNMMLQADEQIKVWGTALPSERFTISIDKFTLPLQADVQGNWSTILPPLPAGTVTTLRISGKNTLSFTNIIFGDLWFLSGQSNMEMELKDCTNLTTALKDASYPKIRFFKNEKNIAGDPQTRIRGEWKSLDTLSAPQLSGLGFYFARELHKKTGRPIGLIVSAWGGTPAETWTSYDGLKKAGLKGPLTILENRKKADILNMESFFNSKKNLESNGRIQDPGDDKNLKNFLSTKQDTKTWTPIAVPGYWETTGLDIDGVVWFKKEITIPKEWGKTDLILELGAIDDFDMAYFNGTKVGSTGSEDPKWWSTPRRYAVPGKLVKPGKNIITVRIFDNYSAGGFCGKREEMRLSRKSVPSEQLNLSGKWHYKIAFAVDRSKEAPNLNHTPTVLYNAMVVPFKKIPIKGILWYQGESNTDKAWEYRILFPELIRSWRDLWEDEVPFYFVQLANFKQRKEEPSESDWAELREAQTTALTNPKTGMVTAIDIGDTSDIHPKNKRELGMRMANLVAKEIYSFPVQPYSPQFHSFKKETIALRLSFLHAQGLRTSDGGPAKGFAIAGPDGKYHWANGKIDGETIIIWNSEVTNPVSVRYAWADNPDANVINAEGLPLLPFRTDSLRLSTQTSE